MDTGVRADAGDVGTSDVADSGSSEDARGGGVPDSSDGDVADTAPELDAMPDAADASETDSSLDIVDASETDIVEPSCEPLLPAFGDGDEVSAFVAEASRCGQEPFALIEPDGMGEVIEIHGRTRYAAGLLQVALEAVGGTVHRAPEHDVDVRVISYATQDRGEETRATAAIGIPLGRDLDTVPIALILHGTSGFTDACALSDTQEWQTVVAVFASWGYIAVAPDYIGLRAAGPGSEEVHPYLVGQPTAIASLDAARAAVRLVRDVAPDLCPTSRTVVWGGSQGGHAAVWTERLAPTYASEFEIVGVAAAVPPLDVVGQMERALTTLVNASGNTLAFFALAPTWYGASERRSEIFHEELISAIDDTLTTPCGEPRPDIPVEIEGLTSVFTESFIEAAQTGELIDTPLWGCMVAENDPYLATIPEPPPRDDYGLLVITGEKDELVHTPIEREAWAAVCEGGTPTEYLECADARHTEGGIWSLPEVGRFLDARAAGEPYDGASSCVPPEPVVCEGTP
jgi:acetyl esterase/lipase